MKTIKLYATQEDEIITIDQKSFMELFYLDILRLEQSLVDKGVYTRIPGQLVMPLPVILAFWNILTKKCHTKSGLRPVYELI